MFSNRVVVCLRQCIAALDDSHQRYLFGKQNIDLPARPGWHYEISEEWVVREVDALNGAESPSLAGLVEDLMMNRQYYRSCVSPRYRFDVPLDDLERFLRLEGWEISAGSLRKTEATIVDLQAEEDALLALLRNSNLPNTETIESHLTRSAEEYGRDNNNSMTNSRQALEQMLEDIAHTTARQRQDPIPVREQVRNYLETCGFFNQEEKRGFSGVYGFLSNGPHPGIVDREAARLGRNFALGACHYALQKYQRWTQNGYRGF
jgi:hypothetical protein